MTTDVNVHGHERTMGGLQTVQDVTSRLDVPESTIKQWAIRFKLGEKLGNRRLFNQADYHTLERIKEYVRIQGLTLDMAARLIAMEDQPDQRMDDSAYPSAGVDGPMGAPPSASMDDHGRQRPADGRSADAVHPPAGAVQATGDALTAAAIDHVLDRLQAMEDSHRAELADAARREAVLQERCQRLEADVASMADQLDERSRQMISASNNLGQLQSTIEHLRTQLEQTQRQLAASYADNARKDDQLNALITSNTAVLQRLNQPGLLVRAAQALGLMKPKALKASNDAETSA